MVRFVIGVGVALALCSCTPLPAEVPLAPLGQEPPLDPNLVYDEDPGLACYPTDIRTGEVVDVCVAP